VLLSPKNDITEASRVNCHIIAKNNLMGKLPSPKKQQNNHPQQDRKPCRGCNDKINQLITSPPSRR
jgi:hypothetical protein